MTLTLRQQRLRLPWLLALPFLYLAKPLPETLLLGVFLASLGLTLRIWASGHIDKDRRLAVHGPYAYIRHPLYTGSFLAGLGLVTAAGVLLLLALYLALFLWLHLRTIRAENRDLAARFGGEFEAYRRRVPPLIPRVRRRGPGVSGTAQGHGKVGTSQDPGPPAFQAGLFRQNRGWEGPLGVLGGMGLLWLKMALLG